MREQLQAFGTSKDNLFSKPLPLFQFSNIPLSLFFFRASIKNPLDVFSTLDEIRKERNLSFKEKLHPGTEVCEEISGPQFVFHQHGRFMDSSPSPNALDKGLVKEMDVLLGGRDLFFDGYFPERIHQHTDVDLIRAACPAGLARNTKPDCMTS